MTIVHMTMWERRECDAWAVVEESGDHYIRVTIFLSAGTARPSRGNDSLWSDTDKWTEYRDEDVPDHIWAALAEYRLSQ